MRRWGVDSVAAVDGGLAAQVQGYLNSGSNLGDKAFFWVRYFFDTPGITGIQPGAGANEEAHQMRLNRVNWLVPICAPTEADFAGYFPGGSGPDIAGRARAVANAFCGQIADVVSRSGGTIAMPTLRPYQSPMTGATSYVLRVYLDIETDQPLSNDFWDNWASAVANYPFGSDPNTGGPQYPFFPCAYVNPNVPATCDVLNRFSDNTDPRFCHGVWSSQPEAYNAVCYYCRSAAPDYSHALDWAPIPCGDRSIKLWQYAETVGCADDPRFPNSCRFPDYPPVDLDMSTPANGDDELYYMLFLPPQPGEAPLRDLAGGDPAYGAISNLVAFDVIRGDANGYFNPTQTTLRCQMAAFICRAMGWDKEDHGNPFTDRDGVDDDLWRNIGTLAYYGVAHGYGDGTFGTLDPVLNAQTISFITRAMVVAGYWQQQPTDPQIYGGVLNGTGHEQDTTTYVHYVGPVPDTASSSESWSAYDHASSRAWFTRAQWPAFRGGGL